MHISNIPAKFFVNAGFQLINFFNSLKMRCIYYACLHKNIIFELFAKKAKNVKKRVQPHSVKTINQYNRVFFFRITYLLSSLFIILQLLTPGNLFYIRQSV